MADDHTTSPELLPCPFCGCDEIMRLRASGNYACTSCLAEGPPGCDTAAEWNRRTCQPQSPSTSLTREADLMLALDLACRTLGDQEPPDSRAVSNQFVAMFSVLCDKANEECREIIRAAIAEHETQGAVQ